MSENAKPTAGFPGAPLTPTGDPMKAGVGPGSWATDRADRLDLTVDGAPKIQPMSAVSGFSIESRDPDPRGWSVYGGDKKKAGVVEDIWVDRSEPQVRYYQVRLDGGDSVLLPVGYAKIRKSAQRIDVKSIFAAHFADVPRPKAKDRITLLEEDKVVAYYAGGTLYADPRRSEPYF